MKYLLLLPLFLFSTILFAQDEYLKPESEYDRVLTYTQMWEEIINCEDTLYELKSVLIIYEDKCWIEVDSILEDISIIRPELNFYDVEFRGEYVLEFGVSRRRSPKLHFTNLTFERDVDLQLKNLRYVVSKNCIFKNGISISCNEAITGIHFDACEINAGLFTRITGKNKNNQHSSEHTIRLSHSKINITQSNSPWFVTNKNTNLWILNCQFSCDSTDIRWNTSSNMNSLHIDSSQFNMDFQLNNITISDQLEIQNSTFQKLSLNNLIYPPETNVNILWNQIKGTLARIEILMVEDKTGRLGLVKEVFTAETNEELADIYKYNDLMTTYNKLFQIYKTRGDLESANGCYIEMKDVQTRRLKYIYQSEGGTENYLNWQLNVFLKFFAKYGTSPVRSIQISIWVILLFAGFYLFFYSEWDGINRAFLISKSEKLMGYFSSEQNLEDLYSSNYIEEIRSFKQFKTNIHDRQAHVPFFFMVFLKPLYWMAVVKHKWNQALYKRIEFLQGRWEDLPSKRKLILGTFTFFALLLYSFYLLFIKSMNALILSINAFTTLGFGDIPVKGISRHIAILQGFLGWFLLSIFSVSLIGQILQN